MSIDTFAFGAYTTIKSSIMSIWACKHLMLIGNNKAILRNKVCRTLVAVINPTGQYK